MATSGDRLDKQAETMDRITLRLPIEMLNQIEGAVDDGQYQNRSEAIRAAVRAEIRRSDA